MINYNSCAKHLEQKLGRDCFLLEKKNQFPFGNPVMSGHSGRNVTVSQRGLAEEERWPCVMFCSSRSTSK